MMFRTWLALIVLIWSRFSHAYGVSIENGVLVGLSTTFSSTADDGPNIGTGETSLSYYDGKIGYLSEGWYFGGIVTSATNKPSSTSENKRSGYGATIGYHSSGFFLDTSYILSATYDVTASGVNVTFEKGTGLIFDLGYNSMINESFFGGVQLTYRSFAYTEFKSLGASTTVDNKQKSEMYPMLNLGFVF
jgi:hypothetical protein